MTEIRPFTPAGVSLGEREARRGHRAAVYWMTGLSAAGKSTLAQAAERRLFAAGIDVVVLDGDKLRATLSPDLGFSALDRHENLRRASVLARMLADAGMVVLVATISPLAVDREMARRNVGDGFHEIYVHADLATCESRDPKGLYAAARAGKIADFTGIDAAYEPPLAPDLLIDTANTGIEHSVDVLVSAILTGVRSVHP